MTKKDRRIKKDTQRTSRAGGKLSDKKSIGGKDKERVVVKLLSLSLNFEALLHWYRDILTAEMSYFLDNAFEVPLLPCQ